MKIHIAILAALLLGIPTAAAAADMKCHTSKMDDKMRCESNRARVKGRIGADYGITVVDGRTILTFAQVTPGQRYDSDTLYIRIDGAPAVSMHASYGWDVSCSGTAIGGCYWSNTYAATLPPGMLEAMAQAKEIRLATSTSRDGVLLDPARFARWIEKIPR